MNFPLILFVLTLITGVIWALDRFYLRKKRGKEAPTPAWIDYTGSFFPVLLIVFVLRSFIWRSVILFWSINSATASAYL